MRTETDLSSERISVIPDTWAEWFCLCTWIPILLIVMLDSGRFFSVLKVRPRCETAFPVEFILCISHGSGLQPLSLFASSISPDVTSARRSLLCVWFGPGCSSECDRLEVQSG